MPGVGSYKEAMKNLKKKKIIKPIIQHINSGKSFLGICLGFQLLFDSSSEFGNTKGLGILRGTINSFDSKKVKSIPHVGWNKAKLKNRKFNLINDSELYYFVHSFYAKPKNNKIVYTTTAVDNFVFCSSIIYKNIYGCQFHPEKSGKQGLNFLKKFLQI